MKLEMFFEKFDQFADAPDAVEKMRELVLQLAVQGKLVPQDTNDEPASVLLERVRGARRRLADKGSLKTKVHIPEVEADDQLYAIPKTWLWVPLNELTELVYGKLLPTSDLLPTGCPVFGANGIIGCFSKYLYEDEMLLISCRGAYSGTPNISPPKCYVTNNSIVCEFFEPKTCDIRFYHAVISVSPRKRIVTGSAQPQVTVANAIKLPVPLPPLAEQKRIVAKVDELMALCDRLEAQQQEQETRHAALTRASLARFADAPTPANLDFIFHPSYAIPLADLRKSILDLAVYGKLTIPARDDDEIHSIDEFREAAASLANSLGLRTPKESLDETEPPFDVPAHWRWMALADIGAAQTGTTPSKNDHEAFNGDIPFIKPADILPDSINDSNESLTRYGAESGSRLAPPGSLLMVCIGTIGKCNLIERECAFNQQINSLSPVQWIDSRYLLLAVRAPYFQDAAWKKSSSTTIAILNKSKWLSISVPVPPLAEQRRIVDKVEQLMVLVDTLETQLSSSHATAANLLTALVAELTTQT